MADKEYIELEAAIANRREYNLGGSYDNDGYVIMGIRHLEAADMKGENDG